MKVLCFGELLLRLAAPGYTRLFQKDSLDVTFCGSEANVAVSLSSFGLRSAFISKLPDNDIGMAAARSLSYFGVDTSDIIYGYGRMGTYYLEKGASQRPSKVIYDRGYSAFALADRDEFDWDEVFEQVGWFHWSGINPALSDGLDMISLDACKAAKARGIIVSCDLNYRSNLWSCEKAQATMKKLMPYVDVCIANEEDAEKALGLMIENNDIENAGLNKRRYIDLARVICNAYGCKFVATTLRESHSASRNGWSAMLYDANDDKAYYSKEYDIQIVDRVGSGDSFAAGIIYGTIKERPKQEIIEFAAAASCLKHSIEGDFNRVTAEEVERLIGSSGSGRIER